MTQTEELWLDEITADLDRNGPIPLYFQVSTRLENAIRTGRIPTGSKLENEIALSERLGLSRPTVRRAIQELVDQGLLVRRRGIGTQVLPTNSLTRPVALTSLFDDLQTSGHTPATHILTHEIRPADTIVASALGVEVGSETLYVRRQRTMDGSPVAILENHLPSLFTDISAEALEETGLYQVLRTRGISFRIAKQNIGARRAEGDEPELLDIDADAPVLTMQRLAYDVTGRAIEFGSHCYRPDRYSFETTLVAK